MKNDRFVAKSFPDFVYAEIANGYAPANCIDLMAESSAAMSKLVEIAAVPGFPYDNDLMVERRFPLSIHCLMADCEVKREKSWNFMVEVSVAFLTETETELPVPCVTQFVNAVI